MALPASGQIDFGQIQTEFGGSNPISMNEYGDKIGLTVGTTSTHDIADFYGLSAYQGPPDIGDFTWGTQSTYESSTSGYHSDFAMDFNNTGKGVVVYPDCDDSYKGIARVFNTNTSTGAITYGTAVQFTTGYGHSCKVEFDPNNANKFVVMWYDTSSSTKTGNTRVGTISGTTITFGTTETFQSATGSQGYHSMSFDPNTSGRFLVIYKFGGNGCSRVGTISGTSISFGTTTLWDGGSHMESIVAFDRQTAGKFVIAWYDYGGTSNLLCIVGSISGTTISYGTAVEVDAGYVVCNNVAFDPDEAGQFVLAGTQNTSPNYGRGESWFGTADYPNMTVSFATMVVYDSGKPYWIDLNYDSNRSGVFFVIYRWHSGDYNFKLYWNIGNRTTAGTTIEYQTGVQVTGIGNIDNPKIKHDEVTQDVVLALYTHPTTGEAGYLRAAII